ncbi:hypothetical protein EYF80_029224 [Liparis tanakae]|uniref:Uncharacterized protein n=1 Tax=Liparis tanakae TaxID=230148 RepID=A0A4Z2H6J1_9TELE|nr:hypothetical protein EYF80_029224 [Liparis tanakae]
MIILPEEVFDEPCQTPHRTCTFSQGNEQNMAEEPEAVVYVTLHILPSGIGTFSSSAAIQDAS